MSIYSTEAELLERVSDERVFCVQATESGYLIIEGCDRYFGVDLSTEELRTLGQALILIADGKIKVIDDYGRYE